MKDNMTETATNQQDLTIAEVETWFKGYEEAWVTLDPDKVIELFTEDAIYRDNPYEDPHLGREGIHKYWSKVTSDQKDVDFTFDVLAVTNNTGIAYWHSEFTLRSSNAAITLDGMFVLEFNGDGLCKNLKEWWHIKVDAEDDS